jgi:hypothetical protein
LLAQDTTGDAIRHYNAFAEVERYRRAEQIIQFLDANPNALKMDISPQRAFYDDVQRKQKLPNFWGATTAGRPRYPDHWSRKSLRQRACDVGREAMYVEANAILSWYVHSGTAGTAEMTVQGFEAVFARSHIFTQKFFLEATATCGKVTKVSCLSEFAGWMEGMRLKTGELIVAEQLRQLEEKQQQSRSGA